MRRGLVLTVLFLVLNQLAVGSSATKQDPFKEFTGSYILESASCSSDDEGNIPCLDAPPEGVSIELSNTNGNRVLTVTYTKNGGVVECDSYKSFSDSGDENGGWSTGATLSDSSPEWSKQTDRYQDSENGEIMNVLHYYWDFSLSRLADNRIKLTKTNYNSSENIGGDGTISSGGGEADYLILRRLN